MTAGAPGGGDPGQGEAREREATELRELGTALGLDLNAAAIARLSAYLDLLERWNRTYNLSAVRERAGMRIQHVADCLAVVRPLEAHRAAGRLLDVGSGGGLPGVVIAAVSPGWDVHCVDAVAKKAAFVRQVAGALALPNLHAIHARLETLAPAAPPFDVVTARALGPLAQLVELSRVRLAPDGVWMAMKGRRPDEEITALPSDIEVFHVEPLVVPGLGAERCLVWMRRRRHT